MPIERKGEGVTKVLGVKGRESSLKHSADGKTAAVIGTDGSITLYDDAERSARRHASRLHKTWSN